MVTRLESNARVFEALVAGVLADQARWRPSPREWSIVEVVNHLADEEVEDFRHRLRSLLEDTERSWPAIDPEGWADSRRYHDRNLARSVQRFLRARAASISWLRSLSEIEVDWDLAHLHPRRGPLRAGDLLTAWLAHDLIHIRQLTRLHFRYLESVASTYSTGYAGSW